MKLTGIDYGDVRVTLLYDPIDVQTSIRLDDLKRSDAWRAVASAGPETVVLVEPESNRTLTLSTARLRYTDGADTEFSQRDLSPLHSTLRLLPELGTRALLVALELEGDVEGVEDAGAFVRDEFLRPEAELRDRLGAPILSADVWIYYGSPTEHSDIRLTSMGVSGPRLDVQLRAYREITFRDPERISAEINDVLASTVSAFRSAVQSIG